MADPTDPASYAGFASRLAVMVLQLSCTRLRALCLSSMETATSQLTPIIHCRRTST